MHASALRSAESRPAASPAPAASAGASGGALGASSTPALSLESILGAPGTGVPLSQAVRGPFEASTGRSLAGTRVHQEPQASAAVDAAGARAVTFGSSILLGSRESPTDLGLMAHEATHVVQQRAGAATPQRKAPAGGGDALESEADRVSAAVQAGRPAAIHGSTAARPQFLFGWVRRAAGAVVSGVRAAASAVADFAGDIIGRAVAYIRERARSIPGYDLLGFILGRDPITQAPVERNATNLLRGLFGLVPGGSQLFENLQQARVVERAFQWVSTELTRLNITWAVIRGAIERFLNSLGASDILNLGGVFDRARAIFGPIVRSITTFALSAGRKVLEFIFEGAIALAGGAAQRVLGLFRRIGDTIQLIINDPVGFLRNLIEAVAGGFRQFGSNILAHLRAAIFDWLFGALQGAGIQLPTRFDLRGILSIILQILGLTYARLRERLVRLIGEPAVRAAEGAFEFLRVLVTEGIAAAWQRILEFAGNLTDTVIEGIKTWVRNTIVMQAIQQIASMLSPVGAIIQACIKIYNTVMFVIERARQIMAFVESVVDSLANIARGNLSAAKNYVERTLARILPLVISFLARFIGLGGISDRIRDIIARIRAPVDRALDRLVNWIRERAGALASRALGGDPNALPQQRLDQGIAEAERTVNRYAGRTVGALVLTPLLAAIRVRHRLTRLDVVPDGEFWKVEGEVNPRRNQRTQAKVEVGNVTDWPTGSSSDPIPIKWFKPHDGFYPTIRVGSDGAERTPRQGVRLPAIDRTPERQLTVAASNFLGVDTRLRRQDRGAENVKAQIRSHLDKLLDLPRSNPGRIYFSGSGNYAVDHVKDLTWRGLDDEANLWPLASAKNNAINASHNQQVRVREGSTVRTNAAYLFPDKHFIIKKVATTAPSSSSDHGSTRDRPINRGEDGIPKKI
jgi:hypothetical protein